MQGGAGRARGEGGDHPNPAVRQLQAQLAAVRAQRDRRPARPVRGRGENDEEEVGGAVGPLPATPEGQPGLPLDIQRPLNQLGDMLAHFMGRARMAGAGRRHGDTGEDENSDSDNDRD